MVAHSRVAGENARVESDERKKERSSVLRYFVVAYLCLFIINCVLGILLVIVDVLHGGVPKSPNCPHS